MQGRSGICPAGAARRRRGRRNREGQFPNAGPCSRSGHPRRLPAAVSDELDEDALTTPTKPVRHGHGAEDYYVIGEGLLSVSAGGREHEIADAPSAEGAARGSAEAIPPPHAAAAD